MMEMQKRVIKEETMEEGIKKSIKMLRAFKIPDEKIVEQLMEEYQLTRDEAWIYI